LYEIFYLWENEPNKTMQKLRFAGMLLIISFISFGCKKNDPAPNNNNNSNTNNNNNNNNTMPDTALFTCKIDGQYFTGIINSAQIQDGKFSVYGEDKYQAQLAIFLNDTIIGTHTVNKSTQDRMLYYTGSFPYVGNVGDSSRATVIVSEINEEDTTASGTFYGTLVSVRDSTSRVKVTDGKFSHIKFTRK
jgi:hypothetical protein